jgi:hypothetical protein
MELPGEGIGRDAFRVYFADSEGQIAFALLARDNLLFGLDGMSNLGLQCVIYLQKGIWGAD